MDWEGETVDIGSSDSDWGDSDNYDTSWYTENEDADEYVLTDAADLAGLAYILSVESCSVSGRIVTSAQTMSDSRRVGGVVGNIQFVQGYKESALDKCAFSGIMLGGFPVMGGVAGSVFNGQVPIARTTAWLPTSSVAKYRISRAQRQALSQCAMRRRPGVVTAARLPPQAEMSAVCLRLRERRHIALRYQAAATPLR